ncbi:hypothetical protein CRE_11448 [Caenorhabditis remanei]|uniref:C2H2-type domain-containing protein n=1 Tax=Caenorhabditis remanei TaxID=31234 RepID=E3NBD5_CAERE|nr:hypothetical protein CRE_11448 [Caenorhabditis remanei]
MPAVPKFDSKMIRSFILYEFLQKRKINEGFHNLCKIVSNDVIGFNEFQFWFTRFSEGKQDLDFQINNETFGQIDRHTEEEEEEEMSLGVCVIQQQEPIESIEKRCKKCGILVTGDSNSSLKEHAIEMHSDTKRFKCRQCDYSDSMRHRVTHHSATIHRTHRRNIVDLIDRPWTELMMECFPDAVEEEEEEMMAKEYGRKEETSYECQMCNVILKPWGNNRWNLKMHVISMHCVSKQYKCRTCGFLVSRKTSARQHSRRIHGKDDDPEDLIDDKMRDEWNEMFGKCFPEIACTTQFQL